jgi:outer membrane protein OmpA-like peptidoglycan-associated protein
MEQSVVLNKARLIIAVAVALELAGCSSVPDALNPINWYRDVMGLSADDDLGNGQNEQNLQAGGDQPYPNLGSVPAPPDTALSSIDRDKLVDSLVADRNNANYSNDDLRAGRTAVTAPPPAAANPSAAPPPRAASPASAPAPSAPVASAAPPPATPSLAPGAAARQRGSEAPPPESPLTSPTVKSLPQGETATPAPPPPTIPPPDQVAMATPRAPALKLRPPGSTETPASAPAAAASASRGAAVSYRIADVRFSPGSALLGDKLRDTIAEIVKLHNESGGTIRIVGHGEAGGGNAAVTGLNLALDRAQAVGVALTDSGVPAQDIVVEAAPVAARGGTDVPRAEVYLEN